MTSSEQYTAAASHLRAATEKAAELWKQGAQALAEQAEQLAKLPRVDPAAGIDRYFELLQQAVDVNRELAGKWASAVTSMSEVFGQQVTKTSARVEQASEAAQEPVQQNSAAAQQAVQDTLAKAQQAATAQARRAKTADRAAAKEAEDKAREPYAGLTKAALAAKLAERSLPKSGTLAELVDRLVESDRSK